MITITEKAKERIIALRDEEGKSNDYNIRVAVQGGGCSGLMYDLKFDDALTETDEVFEDQGVKILVDKKSILYLLGMTLDFSDGLNGVRDFNLSILMLQELAAAAKVLRYNKQVECSK